MGKASWKKAISQRAAEPGRVIKADPTFYPAYYIRAEVFLNQRKQQEADPGL